jgi:hypothetical protein
MARTPLIILATFAVLSLVSAVPVLKTDGVEVADVQGSVLEGPVMAMDVLNTIGDHLDEAQEEIDRANEWLNKEKAAERVSLGEHIGNAAKWLGGAAKGAASWLAGKFRDAKDAASEAAQRAADAAAAAYDKAKEAAVDAKEAVASGVQKVKDAASRGAKKAADAAATALQGAKDAANHVGKHLNAAGEWVADKVEDMTDAAKASVNAAKEKAAAAVKKASDAAAKAAKAAKDALAAAANHVGKHLNAAGEWVADKASDAADAMKDAADYAKKTAEELRAAIAQKIKDAANHVGQKMIDTGEWILSPRDAAKDAMKEELLKKDPEAAEAKEKFSNGGSAEEYMKVPKKTIGSVLQSETHEEKMALSTDGLAIAIFNWMKSGEWKEHPVFRNAVDHRDWGAIRLFLHHHLRATGYEVNGKNLKIAQQAVYDFLEYKTTDEIEKAAPVPAPKTAKPWWNFW